MASRFGTHSPASGAVPAPTAPPPPHRLAQPPAPLPSVLGHPLGSALEGQMVCGILFLSGTVCKGSAHPPPPQVPLCRGAAVNNATTCQATSFSGPGATICSGGLKGAPRVSNAVPSGTTAAVGLRGTHPGMRWGCAVGVPRLIALRADGTGTAVCLSGARTWEAAASCRCFACAKAPPKSGTTSPNRTPDPFWPCGGGGWGREGMGHGQGKGRQRGSVRARADN